MDGRCSLAAPAKRVLPEVLECLCLLLHAAAPCSAPHPPAHIAARLTTRGLLLVNKKELRKGPQVREPPRCLTNKWQQTLFFFWS